MTTLVAGASGATGKLLVEQLLEKGEEVRIIVRSTDNLPENITSHENITIICASILELSDSELAKHVTGCDAIASCLGHTLSFKGIYSAPRRLVTDATRRLCHSVRASHSDSIVKFVLMNTSGNRNRDLNEKVSFGQKCVIALLRLLLPPHVDNEAAADYLRTNIGQSDSEIEWIVVRPDKLIDETETTEISVHSSPTRSAIFDAGEISRINVGCFMADLITDDHIWNEWKGKMPVVYNLARDEESVQHV